MNVASQRLKGRFIMRWMVAFVFTSVLIGIIGGIQYTHVVVHGGSWWVYNAPSTGVSSPTANPTKPDLLLPWASIPPGQRVGWVLRNTHLATYYILLTDMVGAAVCLAARSRKHLRLAFGTFLVLCALGVIFRVPWLLQGPDLRWDRWYVAAFGPPTPGGIVVLPLMLFEWVASGRNKTAHPQAHFSP